MTDQLNHVVMIKVGHWAVWQPRIVSSYATCARQGQCHLYASSTALMQDRWDSVEPPRDTCLQGGEKWEFPVVSSKDINLQVEEAGKQLCNHASNTNLILRHLKNKLFIRSTKDADKTDVGFSEPHWCVWDLMPSLFIRTNNPRVITFLAIPTFSRTKRMVHRFAPTVA